MSLLTSQLVHEIVDILTLAFSIEWPAPKSESWKIECKNY